MICAEDDERVPGFLGRVLDAGGEPVGTCFQVAPGLLATAWHVLEGVGAGDVGGVVGVDPLAGGERRSATVVAVDALSDLAVLETATPLRTSVTGLAVTDGVAPGSDVVITGVSAVDDPGHEYRYLDAGGVWAGGTTRDDQVPLGRLRSSDVMPGMSGAPVRRRTDDVVVGVVSARYNSADGWLRDSVWVARSESLGALCEGLTSLAIEGSGLSGAVELVLSIDATDVRLSGGEVDVSAPHSGVRPGLAGAVDDVRRARARVGASRSKAPAATAEPGAGEVAFDRAGQMLAESFLAPPVAEALAGAVARVERLHQGLRVGVVCDGSLARLPWEALPSPGGGGPLALLPLVNVYRRVSTPTPRPIPGPLRVLVAISSPLTGGGALLNYERELRNVLAAMRSARQGKAHVRVIPFATTVAIRSALEAAPAHVLHLSGHAAPGRFVFEDDDGAARELDADTFVKEAIPAGMMPPVVALAACYTNVAEATGAPSFAGRLLQRGVSVVVASETSVTDIYATRVFARFYGRLVEAGVPDAVAAACDARRMVQDEFAAAGDERESRLAELGEWAVLSVLAPRGYVPVFDPAVTEPAPAPPRRYAIGAVAARGVGEFVGRRSEQRHWPVELLAADCAGLVLHGIGGVGKTTLAAELVGRVQEREPNRVLVVLSGQLSVEGIIGTVTAALRRHLAVREQHTGALAQALEIAARTEVQWSDRLAILREDVLGAVPLLLVLDNFEDNLDREGQDAGVREPVLAALLADWVGDPAQTRFLLTCRYPFDLPNPAGGALRFKAVGPLSAAETRKLVWFLPALDRLSDVEVERIWRMVGGHPRSLEYLDALLSEGTSRYRDITTRLDKALKDRLGPAEAKTFLKAKHTLNDALAEVATLAADDILLDDLLGTLETASGATDLLIGASVYREPIDTNALLYQVGEPDEQAATTPDHRGAQERIQAVLAAAGIPTEDQINLDELPPGVLAEIAPDVAELRRLPTPPRRAPETLSDMAQACIASSLLAGDDDDPGPFGALFFVHRWTSSELERRLQDTGHADRVTDAHLRAADYWLWRVSIWPQDQRADVHDTLEARHHLLAAGQPEGAVRVTETACSQLHAWGAYDDEATLIHDALARLPPTSDRRSAWIHQLGVLAQARGDLEEAEARYRQALEIEERIGDQAGIASCYGQLGILAQERGDLEEAEARYRQVLEIEERIGDQAGIATCYHQLGTIAQTRGDLEEAEARYRQALEIKERIGNQAGIATSYHQLGTLAQARGDLEEAEARYRQSLEIEERLGNQAGIATSYHQLGVLAQQRGDLEEAEARYRQALQINEHLGNQAGIASCYHQLGTLAQARGDLEEAEARYRQSLEIEERLGNQAGIATSISQTGVLGAARDDVNGAIGLHGRALLIRARLGVPEVSIDIHHLGNHRAAVGDEALLQALTESVGPEDAAATLALLNEIARHQNDD